MYKLAVKIGIITTIILAGVSGSKGQGSLPEVFVEGTISEQWKYLDEHARIYENYRAIREDMYRSLGRNALDSLARAKSTIAGLVARTSLLDNRIDSLKKSMEATTAQFLDMSRTKNSISILGIEVNKTTYNSVMWTILGVLTILLFFGYLSFKQHRIVTLRTKKDLAELQAAFEEYRTKTRLEREKTNIDHFKEIMKLKETGRKQSR